MGIRELIALLRANIGRVRSEGGTSVTIASLETLLAAVENHVVQQPATNVNPLAVEEARLQQAADLAGFQAQSASNIALFKSVIATANVTIRSLLTINGGAAVALLAFIGHLVSTGEKQLAPGFASPLGCYVAGVLAAALFAGFVAAAQKLFSENLRHAWLYFWGNVAVAFSIIFAISSAILFAWGSCLALQAFRGM